jgi:chemotaxis protein MotB
MAMTRYRRKWPPIMRAEAGQAGRQEDGRSERKNQRRDLATTRNWPSSAIRSASKTRLTGLQIQIVDDQNRPMFDSGSALVKPYMRDILREIGTALNERGKQDQPGWPH